MPWILAPNQCRADGTVYVANLGSAGPAAIGPNRLLYAGGPSLQILF